MATAKDPNKIDINSAAVRQLTQLPGIAKNMAYNIVNHRERHGLFTYWEELKEVKDFPVEKLELIKTRAELIGNDEGFGPPHHISSHHHVERVRKKTGAHTKAIRATRRPDKIHDPSSHRPH